MRGSLLSPTKARAQIGSRNGIASTVLFGRSQTFFVASIQGSIRDTEAGQQITRDHPPPILEYQGTPFPVTDLGQNSAREVAVRPIRTELEKTVNGKHRTEAVPPGPRRLPTGIDAALERKNPDLSKRQRTADKHHHRDGGLRQAICRNSGLVCPSLVG